MIRLFSIAILSALVMALLTYPLKANQVSWGIYTKSTVHIEKSHPHYDLVYTNRLTSGETPDTLTLKHETGDYLITIYEGLGDNPDGITVVTPKGWMILDQKIIAFEDETVRVKIYREEMS